MEIKKVELNVPSSDAEGQEECYMMWINGRATRIMRDSDVEVEPIVKDMYKESVALEKKSNKNDPVNFVVLSM